MSGNIVSPEIQWLATSGCKILAGLENQASVDALKLEPSYKALLTQQLQFRTRAAKRIPSAASWVWTEKSLAQASDWCSATFKASLLPSEAAVTDACCGAGVDLYAFARKTPFAKGIDNDPDIVELCKCNLQSLGVSAEVQQQEFQGLTLTKSDWLHVDPDRRASSNRAGSSKTIVAEEFSPSWRELCEAAKVAAGAIIKLAPKTTFDSIRDPSDDQTIYSVWIGNRGECRQQLALFGQATEVLHHRYQCQPNARLAVLAEAPVTSETPIPEDFVYTAAPCQAPVQMESAEFVFDLHATLHASDLASSWAVAHNLKALGDCKGYFTGNALLESPWIQRFRVIEQLAWDDRKIRKCLRRLNAGTVEVKNRLHRMDANQFQKRLSQPEGRPLTILVTRLGQRVRAIVAERI